MTLLLTGVTGTLGSDLEEAKEILKKNRIEKLPIVDDNNLVKGLITCQEIGRASCRERV